MTRAAVPLVFSATEHEATNLGIFLRVGGYCLATTRPSLPPSLPAFPRPLLTVWFMASFSSLSHGVLLLLPRCCTSRWWTGS